MSECCPGGCCRYAVASGEANHQVTPADATASRMPSHSEADIQPTGEEDSQLGVAEGAPIAALLNVVEHVYAFFIHRENPGFTFFDINLGDGVDVILRRGKSDELVGVLLPKRLRSLGHVDIAIFTEDDGEAVGFAWSYCVAKSLVSFVMFIDCLEEMKEERERKFLKLHDVSREHAGEFWKYAGVGAFVWYFAGFYWALLPLAIAAYQAVKSDMKSSEASKLFPKKSS